MFGFTSDIDGLFMNLDLKFYNINAKCLEKTDELHLNVALLGYIRKIIFI
jgi:hypothetical protein